MDIKEKFEEPAFVEPEKLSEAEDARAGSGPIIKTTKSVKNPFSKIAVYLGTLSQKHKVLATLGLIVLLGGVSFGAYKLFHKPPLAAPSVAKQPEPAKAPEPAKPTTEASKLTGVQISPELNSRGVTAVMIENSPDARPQSGLKDAGVVFEAIAEGGITRFLALFQEAQPDYIGPVRSARPYYIDWLSGFDPTYAHAGGSPEAIGLIRDLGLKDIPDDGLNQTFYRVNSRYAPHNLYTSTAKLDAARNARGYGGSSFTSLLRIEEKPVTPASIVAIDINPSSALYGVHYDYDATTNSYKRFLAGQPHIDEKSGAQITPKTVIAWVVPYSIHADRVHSVYATIGSGRAFIFQNGLMTEATWTKTDRKSQITFKDANGNTIGLNPGQTWFTAIGSADQVGFRGP